MQADPKDKHVLAGAVHSNSDVLVTDNLKDFDPPSAGPNAMRVAEPEPVPQPQTRGGSGARPGSPAGDAQRYKRDPRTMSALIDSMAEGQELKDFAKKLNTIVPPEQRGTSPALGATERGSAEYAALEGVARPGTVQAPTTAPEARKSTGQQTEQSKDAEQSQ